MSAPATAQEVPADYKLVLSTLRRVTSRMVCLKVNIPGSDLNVTIRGRQAPTPLGFGGWVALTKGATVTT